MFPSDNIVPLFQLPCISTIYQNNHRLLQCFLVFGHFGALECLFSVSWCMTLLTYLAAAAFGSLLMKIDDTVLYSQGVGASPRSPHWQADDQ